MTTKRYVYNDCTVLYNYDNNSEHVCACYVPNCTNCSSCSDLHTPLTNFAMKRGAERQLTKDDGDFEPEARLADLDNTYGSLIHHIANLGYRFQKSSRRNFENQNVRDYLLRLAFRISNQQEIEYVGCRTGPSPLVLNQIPQMGQL